VLDYVERLIVASYVLRCAKSSHYVAIRESLEKLKYLYVAAYQVITTRCSRWHLFCFMQCRLLLPARWLEIMRQIFDIQDGRTTAATDGTDGTLYHFGAPPEWDAAYDTEQNTNSVN
jgi:hypothetical protein